MLFYFLFFFNKVVFKKKKKQLELHSQFLRYRIAKKKKSQQKIGDWLQMLSLHSYNSKIAELFQL